MAVADGLTTQYVRLLTDTPTRTINRLGSGTAEVSIEEALDQLALPVSQGGAGVAFYPSTVTAVANLVIAPDEKTMQVSISDCLGRSVMTATMTGPAATTPNELINWNCTRYDDVDTAAVSIATLKTSQVDPDGNVDGMSLFRGYFVGRGIDSYGLDENNILAAIDGTLSRQWLDDPDSFYILRKPFNGGPAKTKKLGRWFSHVLVFHNDYASIHKKYFDGPDLIGANSNVIRDSAYDWICSKFCELYGDDEYCNGYDQPNIDIIGMSRGGVIANEVAYLLHSEGCTCSFDKTWKPIPVRFAGFYDPVNMGATGRAGWDQLSPNIFSSLNVAAAAFPGGWLSREQWTRPKNYGPTKAIVGTHSAFMGAPTWSTETTGRGYDHKMDIKGAIEADTSIRSAASAAGSPIGQVPDYDYGDLPW